MAGTHVNPTRMELTRLKRKLVTAVRGHKLLKDKRDELMKQFMDVVRENRALRKRVEEELMRAHASFTVAAALMSPEMLEQSLLYPKQSVELDMTFQNIMSVNVPVYHFRTKSDDAGEIYPYGFATTSGELDGAVDALVENEFFLQVYRYWPDGSLRTQQLQAAAAHLLGLEGDYGRMVELGFQPEDGTVVIHVWPYDNVPEREERVPLSRLLEEANWSEVVLTPEGQPLLQGSSLSYVEASPPGCHPSPPDRPG